MEDSIKNSMKVKWMAVCHLSKQSYQAFMEKFDEKGEIEVVSHHEFLRAIYAR